MERNFLADIALTFAGPWPKAVTATLLLFTASLVMIAAFGQVLSVAIVAANLLVCLCVPAVSFFIKRKYNLE